MNKLRTNEFVIVISCLVIGFILRPHAFDKKSLRAEEIYAFQGSRDRIKDQLAFYKENPNFIHPPVISQYVNPESRAWIITSKWGAGKIKDELPYVFKGYFGARFSNVGGFASDASISVFSWNPKSPKEMWLRMDVD